MQNTPLPAQKSHPSFAKALLIAIALILIFEIGFHLLIPLLGLTAIIAVGSLAGAWGAVVATIIFLSVVGLLFFIIPGVLIFLLGLVALIWVIVAVIFFPIVFPIIFPVLVVLLFIGYLRRKP